VQLHFSSPVCFHDVVLGQGDILTLLRFCSESLQKTLEVLMKVHCFRGILLFNFVNRTFAHLIVSLK